MSKSADVFNLMDNLLPLSNQVEIAEPGEMQRLYAGIGMPALRVAELAADSTPFGHSAHADPDTCSTIIRTGSRSAATQGWHC